MLIPALFIIIGISFAVCASAEEMMVTIEVPYTANTFEIQLDGTAVPIDPADGQPGQYKVAVNENSDFITAIQYSSDIYNGSDRLDTQAALDAYPVHMAVWEVNKMRTSESTISEETTTVGEGQLLAYDVRRVTGLDDVLDYEGFAIKPPSSDGTVSGGIRCSLSILTDVRDNGVTIGEDRAYTVEEYGHLHILSRNWNEQSKDHMTVNDMLVIPIYCYKKGVANYVLRSTDDRKVFANSLYDIVDFNVKKNFRGYIRLHKTSTNSDVYLYGPIVGRNPYYVASHLKESGYPNCGPLLKDYIDMIIANVEGGGTPVDPTLPAKREYNAFFIGDSIMMGMTLKSGRTVGTNYTDYEQVSKPPSVLLGNALAGRLRDTASRVNCTLIANGGTTYSEPGANRYNMPQLARLAISEGTSRSITPDFIFLMAGVNDWAYRDQGQGDGGHSAVFGENRNGLIINESDRPDLIYAETDRPYSITDRSYCIGFDKTLKLLTDAYPNANIIVCSPVRALWSSGPGTVTVNGSTNHTLSDYSYVQQSVTNYYRVTRHKNNVYFINLYDDILTPMGLPTTANSVPERDPRFRNFFPDGYHPNQAGYNKICQIILNVMHDPLGIIPDAPAD
ncbi:MAG: SGNH/GDSL hydrolase family protein [Lachnospiraceae bacterium]|nr:SGNH/GDSL hydrolase family protein [Lachnospiraceae bacterium]